MSIARIILITLMLFSSASYGGKYADGLLEQKEALSTVLAKHDDLGIYTPSEFEMELGFINKIFFKDEMREAVKELNKAGSLFLIYLEENDNAYQQLSVDEWLIVAEIMLVVDDLVSRKLAWGNLVIKMAICNKLFYWMFDYIDKRGGAVEASVLDKFQLIQKRLRWHYPSNTSMLYIAMRHYGKKIDLDVSDYVLHIPYYEDQKVFQGVLDLYFNKVAGGREQAEHYFISEGREMVGSFIDLYNRPIPLLISFTADHFRISWQYHEYFYLVLSNSKLSSSKYLSRDVIYNFLVDEYNGEGRFWMTQATVSFVNKPDIYSKNYVNAVTKELFLDSIRRERELAKRRNRKKANKLFSTALLW